MAGQSISGRRSLNSVGSRRDASDTISRARTTAYTVFRSALKAAKSSPAVNVAMASMLSTMSRNRWAGLLEGIDGVVQDVVAEQRLERPSVHHVAVAIEDLIDVELEPGVLKRPHRPVRVQFNQHIDIATRLSFSPSDRAKHRGVGRAQPL